MLAKHLLILLDLVAHICFLISFKISVLPRLKLKTILWLSKCSFTETREIQLRYYLKRDRQTSSLTFALFPLHVSESEGVDISSGYPSIHPSLVCSFICICPASAPSSHTALSCTEHHCQCLSCVSDVRYFMFPSAPCRSCCCDL